MKEHRAEGKWVVEFSICGAALNAGAEATRRGRSDVAQGKNLRGVPDLRGVP